MILVNTETSAKFFRPIRNCIRFIESMRMLIRKWKAHGLRRTMREDTMDVSKEGISKNVKMLSYYNGLSVVLIDSDRFT